MVERFFRDELPSLNDLVMVKVIREEDEIGYYCQLLEYNNIEGFLPLSELVKKKYAKKHILKPDQVLPMAINKVEHAHKIVNLTKKRVSNEESDKKKELYRVCNDINKLINEYYRIYLSCHKNDDKLTITEFMDCTIWDLYETLENDYHKVYQHILHNPKSILSDDIFDSNFINLVADNVNKRITFTNKVINLDLKLIVIDENPISKIKEIMNLALLPGQAKNEYKIKVLVLTSPYYRVRVEGDFDNFADVTEQIKNQIIENSKNIKSILNFNEPKVEREATCKIKYYSEYDLAKI